jgi:hypothetical protein
MPERKGLLAFEFKAEKEGSFRATFSRFDVVDRDGDVTLADAFTRGQEVRIAQWGHNWGAPATDAIKGATLADESEAVLTAVAGLADRLKSLADLRAKEGRTLSRPTGSG